VLNAVQPRVRGRITVTTGIRAPGEDDTMNALIDGTLWVILGDFLMTFGVIGLIVGLIISAVRHRRGPELWATLRDWFIFFAIGIGFSYNFVMHSFFGDFTAQTIGWPQSPFQLELAFASLGIGVIGFMAFTRRATTMLKVATMVGPGIFLWGAAGGHVYQSIANADFAFSNAGPILYTDVLLPVVGIVLILLARRAPGVVPVSVPDVEDAEVSRR
jgi:hypothetical protein